MRKRPLITLTLLFSVCLFLFACRKDIRNFINDQQVPIASLENAKIFHFKQTQYTPEIGKLKPLWNDSWTVKAENGENILVVPSVENRVSNKSFQVRRVFVFSMNSNKVSKGNIVEFVGENYDVNNNLDELIKSSNKSNIPKFSGAILKYNLDYTYHSGSYYSNGIENNAKPSISSSKDSKSLKIRSRDVLSSKEKNGSKPSVSSNNYVFDPLCTYFVTEDAAGNIINAILLGCNEYSTPGGSTGGGGSGESGSGSGSGSGGAESDAPYGGANYAVRFKPKPAINLTKMMKCFDNISDVGATYTIRLCTKIPNKNDSDIQLTASNNAGHAYVMLTKQNGTAIMSKTFGFYPDDVTFPILTVLTANVGSKVCDDAGEQYNAGIAIQTVQKQAFDAAIAMAKIKSQSAYNLVTNNCVHFAVAVFNAGQQNVNGASGQSYVTMQNSYFNQVEVGNTPLGVYKNLQQKILSNVTGVSIASPSSPFVANSNTGICP